jgi:type IV secretory pathway TraG/TraD family ATPase VirD4
MQTRSTQGPTDQTGPLLAAIVAAVFLLLCLFCETERYAWITGFSRPILGESIIGRFYVPWESLEWMWQYDIHFSFAHAIQHGGSGWFINPYEYAWSRNAFAAERWRLLGEIVTSLVVFFVLGYMWSQQRQTSDLHGRARWATRHDLRRSTLAGRERGVVLGEAARTKQLLVHDGSEAA